MLLGRPASLSAQPAARPASPSPLSPARDGHMAAIRQRWARRGRPPPPHLVETPPRVPRRSPPPYRPHPLSSSSVRACSRSSSSSARAIAGKSSAARRRSHQSPNLGAKDTSALAFAAVSCCGRSTEVRSSRAQRIARQSCSDLARELRRDGSCYILPLFARSLVR